MDMSQTKQATKDFLYDLSTCQPDEADTFAISNIKKCQKYVRSMQRKLDNAVANGDTAKIRWYFHLLSKRSRATKVLAVWRITKKNSGKYTAGVDKVALPKDSGNESQDKLRKKLLSQVNVTQKPLPIRRVFIPKSSGKLRPLGIPTIADRIIQDILKTALEPIVEYHFSSSSYGFRPKRCCQDAIEHLFTKLAKKNSRRWVVEGDICSCFDVINQNHIQDTLLKWQTPQWAVSVIGRMLKTKIFHNGKIYDSETGTPQGGVISPMLANVALTTLDEFCKERFGWTVKSKGGNYRCNPMIRYADDFVIVCQSELEAKTIKKEIAKHLKEVVGVELSEEKTKITHIQ